MPVSRAALIGLCLSGLGATPVHAEESPSRGEPSVTVLACPAAWSTKLHDLLRLELRTLTQERREQTHAPLGSVAVECHGPRVRIEVVLVAGKRSHRWVDSGSIDPEARARTLALAATELADALWLEQEASSAPPPAGPRAKRREPSAKPRPALRPSVHLGGSVRRAGRPGVWLVGALVGTELPITRAVAPVMDLRFDAGRKSTNLATVDVLSFSAATHLLVGSHGGRWRWGAGPGMRVGWANLQGQPEPNSELRGDRLGGLWGGPGMLGRVAFAPAAPQLLLTLSLDAGLITLPLIGTLDTAAPVFAMDGGWAGVTLSVGIAP